MYTGCVYAGLANLKILEMLAALLRSFLFLFLFL